MRKLSAPKLYHSVSASGPSAMVKPSSRKISLISSITSVTGCSAPRQLRRARAREAARRAFWSRGLSLTRRRTGVLLYLSLAERHAEIVTDLGVLREIPPTAWDGILAELVPALGRGAVEDGLTAAVERVGACLAEHLPAEPGDPDELPNRVVVVD